MKELIWPGKRGKPLIVDDKCNWLTWDSDGTARAWAVDPKLVFDMWVSWKGVTRIGRIKPPEPGPWYEQKYWIGD